MGGYAPRYIMLCKSNYCLTSVYNKIINIH
jgi:hypothetical protein